MYLRGAPPAEIVTRDPTARWTYAMNPPRARACCRARRGGLGLDPESPAATALRDELRDRMKILAEQYLAPGGAIHFHENHPDVKAALDDVMVRMKGLIDRPQLLRTDPEAQKRAQAWIADVNSLLSKIKSGYRPDNPSGGFTSVPTTVWWGSYRTPTYKIRDSSSPHVQCFLHSPDAAKWAAGGTGADPNGSCLVAKKLTERDDYMCNRVYGGAFKQYCGDSWKTVTKEGVSPGTVIGESVPSTVAVAASSGGGGGGGGEAGAAVPTVASGAPVSDAASYYPSSGSFTMPSFLEGSIAGVPTKYLALGLAAYLLLKRR